MAAQNREFILVGKFQDGITPSLKKINAQLAATTKSFQKMQRILRPIARDMAIMADASRRLNDSFKDQKFGVDTSVRALKEYRREMGKAIAAQKKYKPAKFGDTFAGFEESVSGRGRTRSTPGGRPPQRGGFYNDLSDGFTIEKGVIAGIVVEGVTRVFDMIANATGGAINYLKGAVQERVQDEMSDIKSAGGIFSIGKDKKVAWADTFDEGMALQKKLNAEMANLAAALPGTTNDYVRNMKQVTDTAMKAVTMDTKGMITELNAMKDLGIANVKTQQEAFVQTTKQLAKFSTLAEQGSGGGTPFTMLMEQIISSENVNIEGMKRRYVQLRDPLISGALKDFEKEMNAAKAGSPKRIAAMFKALNKAFPPEVIAAMEKSADGIYQAMKSYIFDPDIGWFGLGRIIKMDFSAFKGNKMGKLEENMSLFELFVKMFGAFGQVLGPILAELPKILEVFDPLIQPMKEFYVNAENTVSNLNAAKKEFTKLKVSFPMFRASLKAIGQLAKSFGANESEVAKLNKMLYDPKMNLGEALQQAMKTLFSSEAMERFGKAIGEALGGFLSMLAGLAEKGKGVVNESGLMRGVAEGWRKSKGSEAIAKIIRNIIEFIAKAIVGITWEAIKTDPIGIGLLATIFVQPIRNAVINFLKAAAGMAESNLDGAAGGMRGSRGNRALNLFRNRRMEARRRLAARQMRGVAGFAGELGGLGYNLAGRPGSRMFGAARGAMRTIGRAVPGGAIAGGVLDVALAKANGDSWGKAAASGIGTVIGGVLGSAFGPVGTMIGMTAGSMIADQAYAAFQLPSQAQVRAADVQETASQLQLQAAKLQKGGLDPEKTNYVFGTVEQFAKRLEVLGIRDTLQSQNLINLYKEREQASTAAANAAQVLNDKITALRAIKTPENVILQLVKPLQDQFNRATKNLGDAQKKFNDAMAATPAKVQSSILNSFQNLTFKNVETILGNKIAGLNFSAIKTPAQLIEDYTKPKLNGPNLQFKPRSEFDYFGQLRRPGQKARIRYAGGLGDAIASEMRMKPPGSDLVIANSSETVIPAAGGYGMRDFMSTLNNGFASLRSSVTTVGADSKARDEKQAKETTSLKTSVDNKFNSLNQKFLELKKKVESVATMGGGAMFGSGGPSSNIVAVGKSLLGMGLQVGMNPFFQYGKGFLPGGGGYIGRHSPNSLHYSGRALDVSGPPGLLDMAYARLKSTNPRELLWRVPGHYDHLHVAYALGAGMPAFFGSQSAAVAWERSMVPGSVKVASVTGNSAEGFGKGGNVTVNAPITIHQIPGQDSEELAAMVAIKLGEAISQARSASVFV